MKRGGRYGVAYESSSSARGGKSHIFSLIQTSSCAS
jgi:hypothetical protein